MSVKKTIPATVNEVNASTTTGDIFVPARTVTNSAATTDAQVSTANEMIQACDPNETQVKLSIN